MNYGAIKARRVKVLLAEVGYLITRLNTTKISARNHVLYVNAVWGIQRLAFHTDSRFNEIRDGNYRFCTGDFQTETEREFDSKEIGEKLTGAAEIVKLRSGHE